MAALLKDAVSGASGIADPTSTPGGVQPGCGAKALLGSAGGVAAGAGAAGGGGGLPLGLPDVVDGGGPGAGGVAVKAVVDHTLLLGPGHGQLHILGGGLHRLLTLRTVEEGEDLGLGALVAGGEAGLRLPGGDVAGPRPGHGIAEPLPGLHVGENIGNQGGLTGELVQPAGVANEDLEQVPLVQHLIQPLGINDHVPVLVDLEARVCGGDVSSHLRLPVHGVVVRKFQRVTLAQRHKGSLLPGFPGKQPV